MLLQPGFGEHVLCPPCGHGRSVPVQLESSLLGGSRDSVRIYSRYHDPSYNVGNLHKSS